MAQLGSRTFGARLFAMLALVALAATYLTPIVNTDWNAWRYDHGHAALAAVGPHTHPWERSSRDASHVEQGQGDDAPFVYTVSGDSMPGITAIWTPSTGATDTLLSDTLVEFDVVAPPRVEASVPLPPPPRSALSHTSHA